MTKEKIIEELVDVLELEEDKVTEETGLSLDSLQALSVITFLDKNFSKKVTAEQLEAVGTVADILKMAEV